MAGPDARRRSRRRDTSGGSPSGRIDRLRRRTTRPEQPDDEARATGRRQPRKPAVTRAFGRAWGRLTTRRAAFLALVVCALALSVAVPLNTYLSQKDALAAQLRQQESLRTQESALEKREQQLSDPAQIEAEAKSRLRYVLPGETPYVVQLPGSSPVSGGSSPAQQQVAGSSWYQALWNSIVGTH